MENIINFLLDLLKINSPTKNEVEITNFIKNFSANLKSLDLIQIGNTLVYSTKIKPNVPTIALYGHTDTVHNQQEFPVCLKEDKIFGCGASDMKSGLAVMLALMQDLKKNSPNFNLQFIFYDAEEGPYLENGLNQTLKQVSKLKNVDLALILEPTLNTIQSGCLGVMNIDLEFKGKSCHSARPWEGENPIFKALPLLSKIANFSKPPVVIEQLEFRETMSITKISAGQSKNVIPASMYANLNYRFSPIYSLKQAQEFIFDFLGLTAKITPQDMAPAGKVITENALLKSFKQKNNLIFMPKQAWTDVARLTNSNIPAVNFGPGDPAMAHQKNEYASTKELIKCYQLLNNFIFK